MTLAEIAAKLNTLKRYEETVHNYYTSIDEHGYGDYVRVDDIAAVLGLTVDKVYDEATETYRGFRETQP